ncbi:hypothetical protein RHGRI_035549 [Rhododendron griersonianum]|uniref:Uncharacterized protein n=1 Tax=Rhododendron griersonianum TaxID=479676 RepID=A0AAV6HNM4_9ERIC|nr:hypothetical protein RHGRI_035549 [Rhododendron griersonianum]
MEGVSESFYGGGKAYWKRRRNYYERLNGPTRRQKLAVVQLGRPGGLNRRRPFFRPVKANTKLRFSPKRFLISIRDAYINFMVRFADGTPAISGGYDGVVDGSFVGFGTSPLKEHDEKMIAKVYTRGPFTDDDKMIAQIYRSELPKYRKEKFYRSLVVGQGRLLNVELKQEPTNRSQNGSNSLSPFPDLFVD